MQAIENGIKAQRFSLAKLPEELLNTPYFFSQYAESDTEVGKVTLKSNADEALTDDFSKKSNADEALNNAFFFKLTPMKR
jgi:hypothetical protein